MNRIALVTGASSGIGRACALGLLAQGWTVYLVGRRSDALHAVAEEAAQAAKAALSASAAGATGVADATDAPDTAPRAIPQPGDVSHEAEVQRVFQTVEQQQGRLDLLFNNAGIFLPYALPGELTGDDWRRAVDVNLNGAFYCLSHAFALMRRQQPQGGRIINNGSISAHTPRPGSIAYTATKHAITGLTKAANLDGRALNIAVGQIDIGNVASDMTEAMARGVRQADGSVRAEACMDMAAVVQTFLAMVNLPLSANVLTTTVMATQMPFVGRG